MTLPSTATVRSVTVPGACLHYEVRGPADFAARRGGPLLLVIGSPMGTTEFAPLADALASDHTVVTLDPRGIAGSTIDDPEQNSTPELRADDVAAILDDLGAESADVFGSSGGAVTGLALVVRHPGRVRTLIAHEPPLLELLPDAGQQRANTQDIIDTYRTDGMQVAWFKFMVNAGFDMSIPEGAELPTPPEPSEDERREAARFFNHELWHTTQYLPDVEALKASPTRVLVGLGVESGHLLTHQTSTILAGLLGNTTLEFPGDHGGFMVAPAEFADALRRVLA
ncbi:MAG TPA: alpha/beta hydrolase [Mycobacterium sp.]|nr:alpha/beta hydrolase [Mycobacterium sp.]